MTESVDELALDIATDVRAAVAPSLGEPGARERVGVAPGGDTTMAIDEIAEHVVERLLRAKRATSRTTRKTAAS